MAGLYERYKDDILSDNTQAHEYEQCKKCVFWGNTADLFTNRYNKAYCDKFSRPRGKPLGVMNNTTACPLREVKSDVKR